MNNQTKLLSCIGMAVLGLLPLPAQGQTPISLTQAAPTVTQDFDAMWDTATAEATLELPDGWRIDRNMSAPRQIGTFADAATEVMYSGGTSLASNASNGTWNFGSSDNPADRAVGGLSTTVSGGTRCVSVMTQLLNDDVADISYLSLSYDIEKYRYGSNTAGFVVQLYYSTDGENWISGGDDFYTFFTPDSETIGAENVPISTTTVSGKNLLAGVESGTDIYLAWNISVASGTSPNAAPGLAIDNISITANYAEGENHYIYVEDNTGWDRIAVYEPSSQLLGTYPGIEPLGYVSVNGVSYKAFNYSANPPFGVIVNNTGDEQLPEFTIAETRDYYLCATASTVTEITDPESYTGYVDPDAPQPSGIYLRGEVNSWEATSDWEFGIIGDGVYALYDKRLSGSFKIADDSWSSACNYGTNGSNILMDSEYSLVLGTDSNISCGSNAYLCKRILLTINSDGATLLLESDYSIDGLTAVYVIGDNNDWNYMDASGQLDLDETDGLFKGRVSLPASSDGFSYWRIYQQLGMGGAWGAAGGEDLTGDNTAGTLESGSTGNVSTAAGTYDFTFDVETGNYSLTKVSGSIEQMQLLPTEVVLVPQLPQEVKVLSLNNSLIYYNDQDEMFNEIAAAQGKNATWTKHTLLGQSLAAHWNEGDGLADDGNPSAKMLVRTEAWSHIILQEQSSLPRTDIETFRSSVKKWIDYIRENCPNPNAVVILPMNWAYAGDWGNFSSYNDLFNRNYLNVAQELGVVVCPIAIAYQKVYDAEGAEACAELFLDDRHPTPKATYMAACMEYSLIFGEDASSIIYHPSSVTDAEAMAMTEYASQAMASFTNYIDHNNGTVKFTTQVLDEFGIEVEPPFEVELTLSSGGTLSEDGTFTADGTLGDYTVTATMGNFASTASVKVAEAETEVVIYPSIELNDDNLSATEDFNSIGNDDEAQLPEAWRIDRQTAAPRLVGTFAEAELNTMYAGGANLPSDAKNGLWNFGADDATDRAIGGITTGIDNGTRAVNVYAHIYNSSRKTLENVTVSYSIEKYRMGSNPAGFAVQLYYSLYDGKNWTSAGEDFYTLFSPDDETAGYESVPGETVTISGVLPTTIGGMCDLYLAWNISVASGDAANAAMALAIDDFEINAQLPEVPTALHYIYVIDNTGWDTLGLYAWGDSELFGSWPGQNYIDERDINGITYKVYALDVDSGSYNLIFNNWNRGLQLPDYAIEANRDFYFIVDSTSVSEIDFSGLDEIESGIVDNIIIAGNVITAATAESITVYSIQGTVVAHVRDNTLDIHNLTAGVYIVKATGNNNRNVVKFIK